MKVGKHFREFLTAKTQVTLDAKVAVLLTCITAIHLVYFVIAVVTHMVPMTIVTSLCLLYYAMVISFFHRRRVLLSSILAAAELLLVCGGATVLLGLRFGFLNYLAALIPTIFFVTYSIPSIRMKGLLQILLSLINWACYCVLYIFCRGKIGLVRIRAGWAEPTFHLINISATFFLVFFFTMLFYMEIVASKNTLVEENSQLNNISRVDPLTGLYNRRSMEEYLKKAMDRARGTENRFCLIMCDIDDFKHVNDTYGHECGDEVIKYISGVLREDCRSEDYVARWGGEEFLVLIQAKRDVAKKIAERIRQDVCVHTMEFGEDKVSVSMTFGVSEYIEGFTIEQLIKTADEYLYYGKNHGKNQVVTNMKIK